MCPSRAAGPQKGKLTAQVPAGRTIPSTLSSVTRTGAYAAAGTVGIILVGYGLREVLRATGGGDYCCNLLQHQGTGVPVTFLGWRVLVVAALNVYRDLAG